MAKQDQAEKTGLDLYIFRDGEWNVHKSYLARDEDKAKQDAKILQDAGGYVGICLVHHRRREIVFSHNTRGDTLTYTLVVSGGVNGYVPKSNAEIRKARIVDRSGVKASPWIRLAPLFVALSSLVAASISSKFLAEDTSKLTQQSLLLPLLIVVFGFTAAFFLYLKQVKGDMKEEAGTALSLEKKWKKIDGILYGALEEFKKEATDKNSGEMVGDSHFGMILMVIGIGEWVVKHYAVPEGEVKEKIASMLDDFGISAQGLNRVWGELYEYLAYPRYKRMYDKGRFIARTRMDNWGADVGIAEAVEVWLGRSISEQQQEEAKIASVLFTDIVDFTSSHQRHGDVWMVDVVKAHNDIVRTALKVFFGKEIKHTGDGIMAAFPSAMLATKAAQSMQHGFIQFTDAMPSRAFDVRIGISAGEPIHMGDDIFGTPVNLAARVMAQGEGRDIMLTSGAYELCKDENHKFDTITGCQLKGFDGRHTLYRINCNVEKAKPKIREDIGDTFLDSPEKKSSFLKK